MIMVQIWGRLFGEGGVSVDHLGWLLFCLCFNLVTRCAGADLGGGCRGCTPPSPPPRDDLRFSNTTGILPKKKLCGLLVLK